LELNEKELVRRCVKGDRRAQRTLYEQYKNRMFVMCLRYACTRMEAEDILQEGFIKVFSDLPQFQFKGPLGAWIRKVILRTALQYLRKQKERWEDLDRAEMAAETVEWGEEPETNSQVKQLLKLIQNLPVGYRTVLNLYILEGYTHPEIARILNISVNTSKSQLSRAKTLLRKLFEKSITA